MFQTDFAALFTVCILLLSFSQVTTIRDKSYLRSLMQKINEEPSLEMHSYNNTGFSTVVNSMPSGLSSYY